MTEVQKLKKRISENKKVESRNGDPSKRAAKMRVYFSKERRALLQP